MTKQLRVAIIGAGPAGIYAGNILAGQYPEVEIDLFDQLPAPYGLIRYGVAPDHPRIKGIVNSLHEMLNSGKIRFFGNVNFGTDLHLADIRKHYHAVIFATGAIKDAKLDIPGIDLDGSYGAADFVSWFDGHPDVPRTWPLEAEQVAVLGNGNVALDVARMLAKHADDLLSTDIPANVYEGLKLSLIHI
jgi:ferredoxin--NADP+ reductase